MLNNCLYLKKYVVIALGLMITGLTDRAVAGPVEDLQPGHWYEVPNSQLRDVAPAGWSANVIDPWGGGAYDTKRDRLIVWGGGHRDYAGNEIYAFNMNTLKWERLTDPSTDVGGTEVGGLYPDGLPRSRHTYDYIEYAPNVDKFLVFGAGGTYPSSQVSDPNTHSFDFDTLKWNSTLADVPGGGNRGTCVYNPADGTVWLQRLGSGGKLVRYDPVKDSWTVHTKQPTSIYAVAAIDYKRNNMVSIGGYDGTPQVFKWDLSKPDNKPVNLVPITTGSKELEGKTAPGFVYDPVSDKFVAWDDGAEVYLLDPETWVWTKVSPSSTNTVTPTLAPKQGTYGRFQYVPSKNVFVLVNGIDDNVFIYKLADNRNAVWPSISLSSSSNLIAAGASVNLTWSSTNATSCEASGAWSGSKATSGTQVIGPLSESTTFILRCTGNSGTSTSAVNIQVDGDIVPPTVTNVVASTSTSIIITFSERVNQKSAELTVNYQITPNISVNTAKLQSNGSTVVLTTGKLSEAVNYILTVSNITDKATSPNVINTGMEHSFTYTPLTIDDTIPGTYEWDILTESGLVYVDRAYTFITIPAEYAGLDYLRTANDDKFSSGLNYLVFGINDPVTVYIGYDVRNQPLPNWLESWRDTGNTLRATHTDLELYAKSFAVGEKVKIGGNELGNSMYVVLLKNNNASSNTNGNGGTGSNSSNGEVENSSDTTGGSSTETVGAAANQADGTGGAGAVNGLSFMFLLLVAAVKRKKAVNSI